MKAEIHPKVHSVIIKCVCGAEYPTVSTRPDISADICSNCHPFYTGKSRMIDTEGRVSRFEKKYKDFKKPAAPKTPAKPGKK